ncbi:MAG: hypothetical protein G8237_07780 [Magnetococcales bacterium]|nr:protein-disulfide reductase DsbD N-terminal domain-containing protein [Magnetococcales bacterium]NGZ06241.1 hypothetical protein [Magnetococcales bacterium]
MTARRYSLVLIVSLLIGWSRPGTTEVFLDPTIAFRTQMQELNAQTIQLTFEIAPGYYLYRDKIRITLHEPPAGITPGTLEWPEPAKKTDKFFGEMMVYYDQAAIRIPVQGVTPANPIIGSLHWEVRFQGCAEAGLCYPPQTRLLSIGNAHAVE